ncbi:MAG: pyruvate kinase, partial [Planctomycetota bacterium]
MNFPSKTKIVCTIGPACNTPSMIEELIHAGMNVARLNFSHGSLADHEKNIKNIREISTRLKKTIAIIQDLSGPKIRVGALSKGTVILKANDLFTLTTAVV